MKITTDFGKTGMEWLKRPFCAGIISILLWSFPLWANTSSEQIQSLINQGKFQQALNLTNKELSADNGNITHRFLKGLILTRLNRLDEARDLFIKLTEEHPDLPEPYNNLAVIYAAQGDFDSARQALQRAINTHPSYATAHENMGDIYAKMAVMAYSEALQLDSANQTAREKLSLVSELFSIKAKEQLDLANAKQAEAEQAIARLARLEQDLVEATAEAKREQSRSEQLRTELAKLERETARAVEKARQEQVQAEQQAKTASTRVERAKAELSELRQMRSETADEAKRLQQEAEQQAKLAQLKVENARMELQELQKKQTLLSEQSRQQQQESEQQAILSQAKVEQARAELEKLKLQQEKTTDQARQQQALLEQQAKQAQAKVEQARLELERLENERASRAKQQEAELAELEQAKQEQTRQAQAEVEQVRRELARLEQQKEQAEKQRKLELAKLEEARQEQARREQEKQQEPVSTKVPDKDRVMKAVTDWAANWSAQDVDQYLSSYAPDFTPAGGLTTKQWRAQRRQRLNRPNFIKVGLSDMQVNFYGDEHAQVNFQQSYQSDTYSDRTRKTLLMKNIGGRWLIVEERSN